MDFDWETKYKSNCHIEYESATLEWKVFPFTSHFANQFYVIILMFQMYNQSLEAGVGIKSEKAN